MNPALILLSQYLLGAALILAYVTRDFDASRIVMRFCGAIMAVATLGMVAGEDFDLSAAGRDWTVAALLTVFFLAVVQSMVEAGKKWAERQMRVRAERCHRGHF